LLLLGVGTLIVVGLSSLPHSQPDPGLREDMNLLRDLVGRIVVHSEREGNLPLRDGALDVYAVLQGFDPSESNFLDLVHSERRGTGPTMEEIRRGDYTHFPWERARGLERLPPGRTVALLWDREPDEEGRYLVGTSWPRIERVTREELKNLVAGAGQ